MTKIVCVGVKKKLGGNFKIVRKMKPVETETRRWLKNFYKRR